MDIRLRLGNVITADTLMIVCLLAGSVLGACIVASPNDVYDRYFFDDGVFYLNMFLTTDIDMKVLLISTLKARLKVLSFLILGAFTRVKRGLYCLFMMLAGVSGGMLIGTNTLYYMQKDCFASEYIGMLIYVVSVIPHFIFYGAAVLNIYSSCIRRNATVRTALLCVAVCTALVVAGAAAEAYISPLLLKRLLGWF